MFHALNKNLNLQLVLLVLLTGWAGWTIFSRMDICPPDGTMVMFQYITKVWAWNDILVRIFALLMVVIMTSELINWHNL